VNKVWKVVVLVVATVFIAVFALACGDDDDEESTSSAALQGAESELCGSLERLEDAAEEVSELDRDSTVDEARIAIEELRTAHQAVIASARGVKDVKVDELQPYVDDVRASLAAVPGSQTLDQSVGAIQDDVEALNDAIDDQSSDLKCP
jgi:hypothetical protein